MEENILQTLYYFSCFSYPPTLEEIHLYLGKKISGRELLDVMGKMLKKHQVTSQKIDNTWRYTMEEYSIYLKKYPSTLTHSQEKIIRLNLYLKLLSLFPQIKLIGLSGSLAMMNAGRGDDIDLFIITSFRRLWIGRFLCIFLAELLNMRRRRGVKKASDKICLNLFFEESDLAVHNGKKNEYIAHEILQMKPLISKSGVYEKFLYANKWVNDIFPNSIDLVRYGTKERERVRSAELGVRSKIGDKLGNIIECMLKFVQKNIIKRHQTTELITQTQLWFHPDDFEKKMEKFIG